MSQDLGPVKMDLQIRKIFLLVRQLDKVITGIEEGAQNTVPSLHVCLAPFLGLWIPELEGDQTGASHGKVGREQDVAGLTSQVFLAIAESEDLQDAKVAAKNHGHALGTALLV